MHEEVSYGQCNTGGNVDENDYTVFTTSDLEFELELLRQSVAKKLAFIDNQVCLHRVCSETIFTEETMLSDCLSQYDKFNSSSTRTVREHIPILRSGRDEHT